MADHLQSRFHSVVTDRLAAGSIVTAWSGDSERWATDQVALLSRMYSYIFVPVFLE